MTATLDNSEREKVPEPLGRRERKKRATRLALKAAALDLVAERGYLNVTVEDIADAVDVSVRTFFNYFPSKEAAVVGDDPETIEAMKVGLIGLPAALTPLEAVAATLIDRMRAIGEDIDASGEDHVVWLRRFEVVKAQPEVLTAYTKRLSLVEHALADALIVRLGQGEELRFYASLVASCAISALKVGATHRAQDGGTGALVDSVASAFRLLASGLAPGLAPRISLR